MQESATANAGEYQIRKCTKEDIPSVIEINMETLPEHYTDYFYYEILSEFPETFFVAELGGSIKGYVMSRIEYGFSHLRKLGLARKGHIVSVAVKDDHRGKGVGTLLMKSAHEAMKQKGATESYLEVRVTNSEAVSLYERLGYNSAGRLEAYYRDGEAALLMVTPLGA